MSATDGAGAAHEPRARRSGPPTDRREAVSGPAASPRPADRRELFRLALDGRDGREPFHARSPGRPLAGFPFPLRGRTVLDLGSGRGRYATALARAGARVVPLDLRRASVRIAADAGLPAVRGEAARLPFAAECFDGVLCTLLLDHVPEPAGAIGEIDRVLRVGGWGWIGRATRFAVRPAPGAPRRGEPDPNRSGSVERILADLRTRPELHVVGGDTAGRDHPALRWVDEVPGAREAARWSPAIVIEKARHRAGGQPPP